MKDLDFDELDKAVNSLMTSVPKTSPVPDPSDQEKTLDITSTLGEDEPLSFDKLDTATAEAVNEAIPAQEQKDDVVDDIVTSTAASTATPLVSTPPPATRRGGRFMDVVHPSSDMKNKPTMPARSVSRQGLAIEPVMPNRTDAPRASAPFTPSVATDIHKEVEPSPPVETTDVSGGWPDPLEMTDFKDDVVPHEAEWSVPEAAPVTNSPDIESSPLTSPFLPDTKVEKRPLGNGSFTSNDEADVTNEPIEPREDKTVDNPEDQLPATPSDVPAQLPEELQSDLVNVEADTHMGLPKTELTHPSEEKLLESGLPPQETATQPVTAVSTGPVSIPQQYREEPSTSDQQNGGIYDTDSYHRPLEHPAKKKSGWMWIIWIIVILLVGAGAGAGLYFSGLIK